MNQNSTPIFSIPPAFADMLLEQGQSVVNLVLSLPLLDSVVEGEVLDLKAELERASIDGAFDEHLQDSVFRKLKGLSKVGETLLHNGQITKEQRELYFWSTAALDQYLALDRAARALMSIDENMNAPPAYQRRATIDAPLAPAPAPLDTAPIGDQSEQHGHDCAALMASSSGNATDFVESDLPSTAPSETVRREGAPTTKTRNPYSAEASPRVKEVGAEAPLKLRPHQAAATLLKRHDPSDDMRLRSSLELFGIRRPLLICGNDCQSPANTILSGHFRADWALKHGLPTVPVIRVDGLSSDGELGLIVQEALADDAHRRLTQSCLYEVEQIASRQLGIRLGRPRSSDNSVETNGQSDGGARDSRAEASVVTGASRNGLADRKKVFGSPVSTAALHVAVDTGEMSLSAAAAATRAVEKTLGGVAKVRQLTPGARAEGQRKLDELTVAYKELKGGIGRPRRAPSGEPALAPPWSEASGELAGTKGKLSGTVIFRDERLQVQVTGKRVYIGRQPPE